MLSKFHNKKIWSFISKLLHQFYNQLDVIVFENKLTELAKHAPIIRLRI